MEWERYLLTSAEQESISSLQFRRELKRRSGKRKGLGDFADRVSGMEEKPGNWSQKHLPLTPGSWASVSSSIKQAQSQPLHVALGRIRDNIWPFPEYTIDAGSKVVIIRWLKKFKEGSVQIQNISPFFYSRDLKVRQQISASRQEIQAAGTFLASSYPAPLLAMNCAAPVS